MKEKLFERVNKNYENKCAECQASPRFPFEGLILSGLLYDYFPPFKEINDPHWLIALLQKHFWEVSGCRSTSDPARPCLFCGLCPQ